MSTGSTMSSLSKTRIRKNSGPKLMIKMTNTIFCKLWSTKWDKRTVVIENVCSLTNKTELLSWSRQNMALKQFERSQFSTQTSSQQPDVKDNVTNVNKPRTWLSANSERLTNVLRTCHSAMNWQIVRQLASILHVHNQFTISSSCTKPS